MRGLLILALTLIIYNVTGQECDTNLFPDGNQYYDTYLDIIGNRAMWKHYHTHDPTVNKQGEWFYLYSTSWDNDAAFKRRSKDLVNWEFIGTAFDEIPQSAQDFFKSTYNPDYTPTGIWAPYLLKYKNKYILYYSAPGGLDGITFAYIGYAISDSANGPWEDQGMITTSEPIYYDGSQSTLIQDTINAIDPGVIYDSINKQLWMTYGSWHTGVYIIELDTATGGIKTPGDRGKLIARRQSTWYGLEGPEISCRNGWYYLFVSYDPLGDKYNVRVGRSRNPDGPYYDFNGVDMAEASSNIPMIQTPYRFKNHPGWRGTAHCGVYNDNGTYYMFNQGRPNLDPGIFVLHVRKIFWINDWPVLSPERYAGVPQCPVSVDSLPGAWEHLPLIYKTSGAFSSTSINIELAPDGTFNNNAENTWTYEDDTLIFNWSNGDIQKLIVFSGWDWENNCKTILYTGMDTQGICIWGKKIVQPAVDKFTKITHGATYTIRNEASHRLLHVPNDSDEPGTSVKQGSDNGLSSQLWKIKKSGDGHYYFFPHHSQNNLVLEVKNGSGSDGSDIIVNPIDGSDKQRFLIFSNSNGYFRILTKVSNDASCANTGNFSFNEGANIFQWDYSGGIHQLWRFERVDSITLDTVSVDTFDLVGVESHELTSVKVFPNPSRDGKITINFSSMSGINDLEISVIDLKGIVILNKEFRKPSSDKIEIELPGGVYIIRIISNDQYYLKKIIVSE